MRINVPSGKTYKISGPAALTLIDGNVEILGVPMRKREKVVVPVSKSLIVRVVEDSILEIGVGEGGKIEEVEERAPLIPYDWREAVERILDMPKPLTLMVLGDVDSGKTVFSSFVVNYLLSKGLKTALIDEDLGQSEIGVPTVIGFAMPKKPLTSLYKASMEEGFFVGSTSPSGFIHRVLVGTRLLYERALSYKPDIIVINTDGWINDDEALELKTSLINIIRPNVIVAIEKGGELEALIRPFEAQKWVEVVRLTAVTGLHRRSPEERRLLREANYRRYFETARIRAFPLDRIRLQYSLLGSSLPLPREEAGRLSNLLGVNVAWAGVRWDKLVVVVERGRVDEGKLNVAKEEMGKDIIVLQRGAERGTLVGLIGPDGRFKGLGVVKELDYEKGLIRILTPASDEVSLIAVGRIKLDEGLREIAKIRDYPF